MRWRSRRRSARTLSGTAGTRSSGARPRCCTTSTTRSIPRSTSIRRTARPSCLDGLEPKSVKKKLKQASFASGVHRDEVYAGAELLALDLGEHIRNVVAALQPIAPELGLR